MELLLNFGRNKVKRLAKVPICPFMFLACVKYDLALKCGNCQIFVDGFFIRCSWVPSWAPDGFQVAALKGGYLHV